MIEIQTTDPASLSRSRKFYRETGYHWCIKASVGLGNRTIVPDRISSTERLVAWRANEDPQGFSFWLGRITEPVTVVQTGFEGVDGAKFRKGEKHICVQHMERVPPSSPFAFTLTETETYVHCKSVFMCDIDPVHKLELNERNGMYKQIFLTEEEVCNIQNKLTSFLSCVM